MPLTLYHPDIAGSIASFLDAVDGHAYTVSASDYFAGASAGYGRFMFAVAAQTDRTRGARLELADALADAERNRRGAIHAQETVDYAIQRFDATIRTTKEKLIHCKKAYQEAYANHMSKCSRKGCHHVEHPLHRFHSCSQCHLAKYCSDVCQTIDLERHKEHCYVNLNIEDDVPTHEGRLRWLEGQGDDEWDELPDLQDVYGNMVPPELAPPRAIRAWDELPFVDPHGRIAPIASDFDTFSRHNLRWAVADVRDALLEEVD